MKTHNPFTHSNYSLYFPYIGNKSFKSIPIIPVKHSSQRVLRSPHVDKRGIDQFDYVQYNHLKK